MTIQHEREKTTVAQPATTRPASPAPPPTTPHPLESGDRLSRAEFERRYEAMPQLKKAELVEGVVYVGSPVRHQIHSRPNAIIVAWLATYAAHTPGTEPITNGTVRLDADNEVQPDAGLRIATECGGQTTISSDDYIEGAPELVVEITASTAAYDSHDKLRVYRRNGVQEYIVWRTLDNALDWYRLVDGEYRLVAADEAGIVRSEIFPGLWLDGHALLDGDLARVLATLQTGLQSAEHARFVEGLQERASRARPDA